jgi:hypothetical protein
MGSIAPEDTICTGGLGSEWEVDDAVRPLLRLRRSPNQGQILQDFANGEALPGDDHSSGRRPVTGRGRPAASARTFSVNVLACPNLPEAEKKTLEGDDDPRWSARELILSWS